MKHLTKQKVMEVSFPQYFAFFIILSLYAIKLQLFRNEKKDLNDCKGFLPVILNI